MLNGPYAVATRLAQHLPLPECKLRESLRGRRAAVARWLAWASEHRTQASLVWVHHASVGEGLAAAPVTRRLRAQRAGIQVVHSFSSPSAARWPGSFGADFANYLPPEDPSAIDGILHRVAPSLVLCSRGDLWPEFVRRVLARGVPIAVAGGTVRPASLRLRAPVRPWLAGLHRCLTWVGAVTENDARLWAHLGVPPERIAVTGDPRHEQVLEREQRCDAARRLLEWAGGESLLVAGSTDPADERIVLSAYRRLGQSNPTARLVVVPHDPSPARVRQVREVAARVRVPATVWNGGGEVPETPCLIFEGMGKLADLYAAGDIAYVGGGFRRGGVHAVGEPAAFGVPVLLGPRHDRSGDALRLLEAGGGVALPSRGAEAALCRIWSRWIDRADERTATGLRARSVLREGASRRTLAALLPLIGDH